MSHSRPDLAETATADLPKIGIFEPISTATGLLVSLVYEVILNTKKRHMTPRLAQFSSTGTTGHVDDERPGKDCR